jgi:hypothetical protein
MDKFELDYIEEESGKISISLKTLELAKYLETQRIYLEKNQMDLELYYSRLVICYFSIIGDDGDEKTQL